jgi:hypothetical protein
MRFDVATTQANVVFELAARGVECVADRSAHVFTVLSIGDDFASGRLQVDAHGELRALVSDTLHDHATADEVTVEMLEVIGMLADDLVELIGVRNVAQRDLQGREHA